MIITREIIYSGSEIKFGPVFLIRLKYVFKYKIRSQNTRNMIKVIVTHGKNKFSQKRTSEVRAR